VTHRLARRAEPSGLIPPFSHFMARRRSKLSPTSIDKDQFALHEIPIVFLRGNAKRINAMNDNTIALHQTEEDILTFEVSDEVLEIAAGTEKDKANYTLGACTGLSVCPG
jgi:hypothetical protein